MGERFQTVVLKGVDANADVPPPAAKPAPSASKPSAPAAKRTEGNRVGVLRQGSTTLPTRHDRDINAKQCKAQANHEQQQREYNRSVSARIDSTAAAEDGQKAIMAQVVT